MMTLNKKEKSRFPKYVVFSGMVFQMGITIALFAFIGVWLDKKFPNEYSVYTIILSLTGVFGSIYTVIKQVLNISKNEKK